jgi:hypothetical protein
VIRDGSGVLGLRSSVFGLWSVVDNAISGVAVLPELLPVGDLGRAVAATPEPSGGSSALRACGFWPCCGDCCGVALV